MKIVFKIILTLLLLWLGCIISLFFNFNIIYSIVIPDPERFAIESRSTSKLFDLFFEVSSYTSYHPEPSGFYFKVAYAFGLCLGGFAAYKLIWRKTREAKRSER